MSIDHPAPAPAGTTGGAPPLPRPRGPLSARVLSRLRGDTVPVPVPVPVRSGGEGSEDLQLALYCCYELHYRGFSGVDPELEWDPDLLALRRRLEARFLAEVKTLVGSTPPVEPGGVEAALSALASAEGGPSLSAHLATTGTLDQMREFCIHRSAYQLKEADPHTWCLPRLAGPPKAAMVEIQTDEYGGGRTEAMHAELFAATMAALDLDATYGAHLDSLPAATLATVNLVSMFGLHRRWRGALIGHLALFEMTSVGPMSRYSAALARFGAPEMARRFYDTHVEIDAHHQQVALERMVRGFIAQEPGAAADVVFGARALTAVEARFAGHLLDSWAAGRSSLRD